jgi:predicted DCC family thiol-disulfide oxidoreductase YuxK
MSISDSHPIVIFDGVCNLCNASVDFVIRHDPQGVFKVSANQHETGQRILREQGVDPHEVDTVFLYEGGTLYRRSTAALRIVRHLGLPWSLLYGLVIIPAPLRDFVYRGIARNRYRWFGKKETCRLPTADERARFLL